MGIRIKDLCATPWSQDDTWIHDAHDSPVANMLEEPELSPCEQEDGGASQQQPEREQRGPG